MKHQFSPPLFEPFFDTLPHDVVSRALKLQPWLT